MIPVGRRFVAAVSAAVLVAAGAAGAVTRPTAAPARVPLVGSVSAAALAATRLGPADPRAPLHLAVGLALRDRAGLDGLVREQSTPGGADFHRYITPSEFARRFAAAPGSVERVEHALEEFGLGVSEPGSNRMVLDVTGTVAQVQSAFGVRIERVREGGREFLANTTELLLPRAIAGLVDAVAGIDGAARPQPRAVARGSGASSASPAVSTSYACPVGKVESGAYMPEDFAAAYDFNGLYANGFHGEGMSAALVEYDDYHTSDVAGFESCMHIARDPVTRVLIDAGAGGPPGSGQIEDLLDIDTVLGMAPALAHLFVYVAPNNTNAGEIDLYDTFVARDDAAVLSSSWGYCEDEVGEAYAGLFNAITEEAAAQGQQILDAAGDSGSQDCVISPDPALHAITAELQSASPFVMGVGGTTLLPTGTECVWNGQGCTSIVRGAGLGAGGGGQSKFVVMPAWQRAGPGVATNPDITGTPCSAPAGQLCRAVPDITADADLAPGYAVYCNNPSCALLGTLPVLGNFPPWFAVGGTSASTPLTASMVVLVDQEAKSEGLLPLGYVNPLLYEVASDPSRYAADFHDITLGSNDNTGAANGKWPARTGFDLASGLGSFDAANLASDIVAQSRQITLTPSVVQRYGYTSGPATTQVALVSSGFAHQRFSAVSDASWLRVTRGGVAPASIRVTTDPRGLTNGSYVGHITVTGATSPHPALMTVTFTVGPRATLRVAPGVLSFREPVMGGGAPSCSSTWDDENSDPSATPASTRQTLTIRNASSTGTLHWGAIPLADTGGLWLEIDALPKQTGAGPAVPMEGAIQPGGSAGVALSSQASLQAASQGSAFNTPPGTYTARVLVYDLADPSVRVSVPAVMALGNGARTPVVAASPQVVHITVAPHGTARGSFSLSDAAHSCGYQYSTSSDASWLQIPDPGYAGSVASDTSAPVDVAVDAASLQLGVHVAHVEVNSTQVAVQPYDVTVVAVVTGVKPAPPPVHVKGETLASTGVGNERVPAAMLFALALVVAVWLRREHDSGAR